MKKIINAAIFVAASLLLAACTGSSMPAPSNTPSFKAGSADGCATASGAYTKNTASFHNDKEYQDGWFYGRKKCNPANSKK